MATISADQNYVTNIMVFTTDPGRRQELLDVILAGEDILNGFPGLVSTTIHVTDDGARIISYAQWESKKHLAALRESPALGENLKQVRELADDIQFLPCSVVYSAMKNQ
ncbi:antibiotic biosynthesis monooxygenase family protein [Amycolatopsis decaplanina]|uniref:Antibiotic biosynthesis monooxygenase n=1 Tax=Amycolatopsis decaplanina DSM 44594 TaxID=1284240 RepID=M2ZB95_9PSEU|nr:antibiotic biosynthesis monooxygenase [Amycolatopsis decaplanina]EME57634.1 antibiotic biosynthesis monooxygenase [Amycolatopsis decaplanina DSM 44594]